jgi:CBS domain-containing protein
VKVSELMTSPVITARENTDVADVARLMLSNNISGVPIVDHQGQLVGIVTEGDLVVQNANVHFPTFLQILDARIYLTSTRHFEEELRRALGTTAADMMTRHVLTVSLEDEISEAATLMADKRVNPVPVLDGERLVGIISRSDIIRHILAEYEDRAKA